MQPTSRPIHCLARPCGTSPLAIPWPHGQTPMSEPQGLHRQRGLLVGRLGACGCRAVPPPHPVSHTLCGGSLALHLRSTSPNQHPEPCSWLPLLPLLLLLPTCCCPARPARHTPLCCCRPRRCCVRPQPRGGGSCAGPAPAPAPGPAPGPAPAPGPGPAVLARLVPPRLHATTAAAATTTTDPTATATTDPSHEEERRW
jgi:hypothetical protein